MNEQPAPAPQSDVFSHLIIKVAGIPIVVYGTVLSDDSVTEMCDAINTVMKLNPPLPFEAFATYLMTPEAVRNEQPLMQVLSPDTGNTYGIDFTFAHQVGAITFVRPADFDLSQYMFTAINAGIKSADKLASVLAADVSQAEPESQIILPNKDIIV